MSNRKHKPKMSKLMVEDRLGEVRERMCLACLHVFVSSWAGNRICDNCKQLWTIKADSAIVEHGGVINQVQKQTLKE